MFSAGTTNHREPTIDTDPLVVQLLAQECYAEVYELLSRQKSTATASLYNMALCLHWSGNFQEALNQLEKIQLNPQTGDSSQYRADSHYQLIRNRQNQYATHLKGMSEAYIKNFPALVHDAVVRLKTNCWLQLGNYTKVIATATPIARKGYKDITDALQLANSQNDKRL